MKYNEITPGRDDLDRRLDRVIRKAFPGLPLGEIYKYLRKGLIKVKKKKQKADYRLKPGDIIQTYTVLTLNSRQNTGQSLNKADILIETGNIIVVNKKIGILIHGDKSLNQQVGNYLSGKIPESLSFRPGPLHRLDRNTSGIVVFGKSLTGAREFSTMLTEGFLEKYYLGILEGKIRGAGIWTDSLIRNNEITRFASPGTGQEARTSYRTLLSNDRFSLVLFQLHTGRTHQIRAHASGHGHPLYGDKKYGSSGSPSGYFLHAWLLTCSSSDPAPFPVTAPLPDKFMKFLQKEIADKNIVDILSGERKRLSR